MRHSLFQVALVIGLLAVLATAEVSKAQNAAQDSTEEARRNAQAEFNRRLADRSAAVSRLNEFHKETNNGATLRLHELLDKTRVSTVHAIAVDAARWNALTNKMHTRIARLDREMTENVGKVDAGRKELHTIPPAMRQLQHRLKKLAKRAIKIRNDISFAAANHKAENAAYATESGKLQKELAGVVALKNKLVSMEQYLKGPGAVTYAELAATMTAHYYDGKSFRVPDASHYERKVQGVVDEKHRTDVHILTALKDFEGMVDKETGQVLKTIKTTNDRHTTQSKLMTQHDALLANELADNAFNAKTAGEKLAALKVRQLDLERQQVVLLKLLDSLDEQHKELEAQAHAEAVAEDRKQRNLAHQRDVELTLLALIQGKEVPTFAPFVATAEAAERRAAEAEARTRHEQRMAHDARIAAETKLRDEEEARLAKLAALTRAAHRSKKEEARHAKLLKEKLEEERQRAEYEKLRAAKGKEAADAMMAAKLEAKRYELAKAALLEKDKMIHKKLLQEEADKVKAGLAKLKAEHEAAEHAAAEQRAQAAEAAARAVEHSAAATQDADVADEAQQRANEEHEKAQDEAAKQAASAKREAKFAARELDHGREVKREVKLAKRIDAERRHATKRAHQAEAATLRGNWDTDKVKQEQAAAQARAASDEAAAEAKALFVAEKQARVARKQRERAEAAAAAQKARADAAAAAAAAHEAAQTSVADQERARQAAVAAEAAQRAAANQATQDAIRKAHAEAAARADEAKRAAAAKVAADNAAVLRATQQEIADHKRAAEVVAQQKVAAAAARAAAEAAAEAKAFEAKAAAKAARRAAHAKAAADAKAAREAELARREAQKQAYRQAKKAVFHQ